MANTYQRYWAEVAATGSLDEIREQILTGYKDGKAFEGGSFYLLWPILKFGRILDFGCGLGRNFSVLKKLSHQLVGYDIPEMIEACRHHNVGIGVDLVSNFDEVKTQHFDLVVAELVFQHIEDPEVLHETIIALSKCCARLYLASRVWGDGPGYPNVLAAVQATGVWECVKSSPPEKEACLLSYPDELHFSALYHSRDQTMKQFVVKGPKYAFKSPEPEVRVGFVTPSLVHPGGAERWIEMLINYWSGKVKCSGICVTGPTRSWEIVQELELLCPVMFGEESLDILFERSDVIIAWGLAELPEIISSFKGKLILVSHGSCVWTKRIMTICAPLADVCVAVSEVSRLTFPESQPVRVIHNGIDPSRVLSDKTREACREAIGLKPGEIAVGYMGRYSFEKNPTAAAIAVRWLGKPYRAVFVGGGWQENEVLAAIREQVDDAICLPATTEVASVWNALDCFVLTSPSEGMSLSLIEAWLAKVPVVSTRVGAMEELTEVYGQIAQEVAIYPTPEDLAEKVGWAAQSYNNTIVDRAYDMAMGALTAEIMVQNYEDLILELHNNGQEPKRLQTPSVRVGVVTPSLTFPGGAEQWILSLLKMQHEHIKWQGVSVVGPDRHWICVGEAEKVCSILFGPSSPALLAAQCDIIISWGLNDLADYIPDYKGKVISVAQGCGQWTADILTRIGMTADACVGISEFAAMAFPKPKGVHIIHNSVEPDRVLPTQTREVLREELGLRPDDVAVGYIGRYSKEKNALAAARAVRELGPPYRAVYMGDGTDSHSVLYLLREMLPNVIIIPPQPTVESVLPALDCFVMASSAEGGCIAFAEAWLCRVPLVATPVGMFPELQRKNGPMAWEVPLDPSAQQLAAAVKAACDRTSTTTLASTEGRTAILNRAENVTREFLLPKMMHEKYAELFLSLMKE